MDFITINSKLPRSWTSADKNKLYLNQGTLGAGNHYCRFKLTGTESNLDGIGATLTAEIGDQTLTRQVLADTVFAASSSRIVHFGLGKNIKIDRLTVQWPSGTYQELLNVPANMTYPLVEPRVTLERVTSPIWTGSSMDFPVTFRGRLVNDPDALVIWMFYAGANGPSLGFVSQHTAVSPGLSTTATLQVPLAAQRQAALQGLELEQHTYLVGDFGIDCRKTLYTLP